MAFYIFLAIVIGAVAGVIVYFFLRWGVRRRFIDSLTTGLYLITIPRGTRENVPTGTADSKDFKAELAHFEQLLASLSSLRRPFTFEVAVPHFGEEIRFYINVPKISSEVVAKQIQGLWPGASVALVADDFTIFNPNGTVAAAYIAQKEPYALPIKTYAELGIDPFEGIIGGFSKINEIGEGAALQVIIRPAPSSAKQTIQSAITQLKKGESLKKIFGSAFPSTFAQVGATFNPQSKEELAAEKKDRVIDEEALKAISSKIAKPLFAVNVRVLASAGSPFQATDILDGLTTGFTQFAAPLRNELKIVKSRNPKNLITQFIERTFDDAQTMIVSGEELASFYHLPISSTNTPRVKWMKSKEAAPPENMPKEGLLIGESVFRGEFKEVYLSDDDRRRHLYAIGQTGTGKSTLLGNLIREDILAGRGVAVIDPHGDLVANALKCVPAERMDDVIYFDPGDLARPLGLNMLDFNPDRPEEKTFIVNEMQGIFNKLFAQETMGPMFEQYMRNALLLLMEDMPNEPATLVEVPRIFTDPAYRARKLERIHNPVVIDFWQKEAVKAGGEASLANMTPYITSKFNNFISNDYLRPIIGQPKSAFNFREAMDSGKIILINLSKGRIGDLNASLLGLIFTGKLLMAALSRVDVPDIEKRRDFYLYIDEFQNFATDSIATILSEARKYRLNLTVAHQFIAQLTEKIRDAVFGNVGSLLAFRIGVQDAETLEKQFAPTFDSNDLVNVENLNCYAKLLIGGQPARPFAMRILGTSWTGGDDARANQIKESSRTKYGADRQIIEDEIYKRLRQ
jgi:hypothetical protein